MATTRKHYLPDSSRNTITTAIDGIFERLRYKLLGPYYQPKAELPGRLTHDKILSLPGMYSSAYVAGGAENQPSFQSIKGLASVADTYIQAASERFKAKALAEIENQMATASLQSDYNFEQELNDALIELFDKAQGETKRILETEVQRAKTIGVNDSALEFMTQAGDEDGNVYALTRQDKFVCRYCRDFYLMPDGVTPKIYKLSELKAGYLDRGNPEPNLPPVHPNCFLGGEARVITKDGYKKLKYINIGDHVLTHKLRWRKVINTLNWYTQPYTKEFYNIKMAKNDEYGISVTPDHKLLTVEGFSEVSHLKDKNIMKCVTKCLMCEKSRDEIYPGYFCGAVCRELFFKNVLKNTDKLQEVPKELAEFKPIVYHEKSTEPVYLYDITVDEDHSFIANGIVSHNCRCLLLYLPKGFKLLPGGKLEFVASDHDEYDVQKPLKKSVNEAFYGHKCDEEHEHK